MAIERLVGHFGAVADPRCRGKVEHRLTDILVIAVCAVIACAESWNDIALYGRSKLAWLRTFLELPNGIPSHDTFRRVFMLIDPEAFEAGFSAWAGSLAAGFEREVVAIDGKTLRRSFDRKHEHAPLHLVSAWASEQDLVLGQRCVDDKSNEITAIPELLDRLTLQNSIVTVDAMGCQTAIAERILAREADYLLTLKANHPLAHAAGNCSRSPSGSSISGCRLRGELRLDFCCAGVGDVSQPVCGPVLRPCCAVAGRDGRASSDVVGAGRRSGRAGEGACG
jgi:hypothetical protein